MMENTEKDVINLLDEEGNEHEFEIIDAVECDDQQYLALVPIFDEAEDSLEDSGELVILRVCDDEGGSDDDQFLEAIEDEGEYTRVADMFMERLKDEFDFEEEDEAEEEKA